MLVMAAGALGASVSPTVWVAACCTALLGIGNGAAIACNALLVQRGTFDVVRGRALTFVMSLTYLLVGCGSALGGLILHDAGARWVWAGAGLMMIVAAGAGTVLARRLGGETAAAAERMPPERPPVAATN